MALDRLIGVLSVLVKANTAQYEAGMGRSARETANAEKAVKRAEREFFALTRQIQNAGRTAQSIGQALTVGITLPLAAAGGMAVKTAISWESAFAGVKKTVGGDLRELEADLRRMATQIPVPAEKLAGIAQSAGQLGIARENITSFTRVIADLSVATNLTAEQGAQDLARLANITRMPQTQFINLGSAVVALGNNFATTEQDIVAMALRLAGAGNSVGMTEADILGLATALSSVGIEAEAGGTALSRVMKDMAVAVSKGGQELQNFAAVAAKGGVKDFATVFKQDAAEAVGGFIQGLVNIRKEGGDVVGLLSRMGIEEIRMSDALLRTAGAGDLVARALRMSGEAWRAHSALTKEADERYKTTASRLQVLRNKLGDVGITLGGALLPGINAAIALFDRLFPKLQGAAEWFAKLPGGVQLAAVGFLGLAAAAGPAIYVVGSLVVTVGGAMRTLQEFGVQATLMGARATLAAAGTRALGVAAAITGPGMAVLNTAVAALGNTTVVTTAKQWLATAATTALSVAQRALAIALAFTQGVLTGLLGRLTALPIVQSAAAASTGVLVAAQGALVTTLSLAANAVLVVGVAFAAWKVGTWIGETTGLTDALGKLFARLMGGHDAVRAYERGMQIRAQADQHAGETAEQAAARIKQLQDQLSGATAARGVEDMERAVRGLAQAGQLTQETLDRVVQQAAQLEQAGAKLSPYLASLVAGAQANRRLLDALEAGRRGGKPGEVPGISASTMSAEQQAKSLVQVQGELAKLQAAHRGTYAAAVADIKASIASRLQEAAGVAALTGALLSLQGAQLAAARDNFLREQLGSFQADYQRQVADIAQAVQMAQQLGRELSTDQLADVGQKLAELQQKGAAIPAELEAIVARFRLFQEAERDVQRVNQQLEDQRRIVGLLGPSAQEVTNAFLELERSVELRTGTQDQGMLPGLGKLAEEQLENVVRQLRELQQQARAANVEVPGLAEALGAAWRRLQDLQAGPDRLHEIGVQADAASAKTITWSERVRDLAASFEILGLKGDSGLGRLIGGLTGGVAAFEQLKKAATITGPGGIKSFDLGSIFKAPDGKVGVGSIISGITTGLQAASAAVNVGKAIVGLFRKSPVEKAAEEAGRYVGSKISGKLAQAILDDSKKLGISIKSATLLHLGEALAETGRSIGSASAQIGDLFLGIKNGSVPAKQGVEELGELFSAAGEEAASIGKAYNAATVAMIQAARQTGIALPGMAEAVAAGLDKVVAGFEKVVLRVEDGRFLGGLDPTAALDPLNVERFGRAQGQLFADSFWVVVGERGLVAGADAFRQQSGSLRESFADILPGAALDALLGPIERIMALTAPGDEQGPASLFRGAAEAASGLKDVIDGLAQSGYLTAQSLANAGTLTLNAYEQALAGGATDMEALQAVKPALQANLDAAAAYGLQLDENTARLVQQAEAAGMTFKVDPMMQMVDLLKVIAQALGAELPASLARTGQSLGQLGQAGNVAAGEITKSFGQMGEAVAQASTEASSSFNAALQAGMANAVSTTADAMSQMAAATEVGWGRVGHVSDDVLERMQQKLDGLRGGIVVPIEWAWQGGDPRFLGGMPALPGPALPAPPEIPRAAKGLYARHTPGGSMIVTGEAGDEITAPVDAVLQRGFAAAQAPLRAFGELLVEVRALRAENAAMRGELSRLADRPVDARLQVDGREIAAVAAEDIQQRGATFKAMKRALDGQRVG